MTDQRPMSLTLCGHGATWTQTTCSAEDGTALCAHLAMCRAQRASSWLPGQPTPVVQLTQVQQLHQWLASTRQQLARRRATAKLTQASPRLTMWGGCKRGRPASVSWARTTPTQCRMPKRRLRVAASVQPQRQGHPQGLICQPMAMRVTPTWLRASPRLVSRGTMQGERPASLSRARASDCQ